MSQNDKAMQPTESENQEGKQVEEPSQKKQKVGASSDIIKFFREYQAELDQKHDKHERLVKLSRDVTIESKRIIFLLHRHREKSDEPKITTSKIFEEAKEKLTLIQNNKFKAIAEELKNEDPHRFMRAVSPGLQEYIEALSFYHYLERERLITLKEVQQDFKFESKDLSGTISFEIPVEEYLLGVADLSGELMRLAINHVSSGNFDVSYQVCEFLQALLGSYSIFGNNIKELSRKLSTLRQSLIKVENACYTIRVRGCEIPTHILADVIADKGIQE